eukprot:1908736-Prymnesium_polylepis.1
MRGTVRSELRGENSGDRAYRAQPATMPHDGAASGLTQGASHTQSEPPVVERYALLVRGQSLRWGCGEQGVFLQRLCVLSQLEMLVKPLRIAGHSVDTFIFAFDHPAAGCNRSH